MEDLYDDWLFDSIRKYKNLLMFDLHDKVIALDWVSDRGICVSTCGEKRNELLELTIPEKIMSQPDAEGLCSDRDFRVKSGGFSERPITELKHIPQSRCVATAEEGYSSISIWHLGSECSDLIEVSSKLETRHSTRNHLNTALDVSPQQIIFGSQVNNICCSDITTATITKECTNIQSDESVDTLLLDGNTIFACCKETCQLWRMDLRESPVKGECHKICPLSEDKTTWTYAVKYTGQDYVQNRPIKCLSSHGILVQTDLRKLGQPVDVISLGGYGKSGDLSDNKLCLQVCSTDEHTVSMSGFDSHVHMYNLKNHKTGTKVKPDFTHEGHMACSDQAGTIVTAHIWHPWQPNLILSAASDGSLHAWQREISVQIT